MKLYKGWKVTNYESYSCIINYAQGSVRYVKGKWTKPHRNNGPLAVFDNLNDALRFNEGMTDLHKCLYEKSEYTHMWYIDIYSGARIDWAGEQYPSGTSFASRVMIVD